jgi:hypothetical protein
MKGEAMATSAGDLDKPDGNERPGGVATWIATALGCAYIVWNGTSLYLATPVFINMYNSMGVDLALSTKTVIASYRFLYPVVFIGAAALVILKQFYVRQKWVSLTITLSAVVVVDVISSGIVRALYHPLFDLMEKLNR